MDKVFFIDKRAKYDPLRHGCTHIAGWLEQMTNEWTRVALKKIVGGQDAHSFDFYQVNNFTWKQCK